MQTMPYIGDRLKELRMQRVWRQNDLADKSGVGIATIVRIERNQVEPHQTTIRKLAEALGVEPSTLVR